MPGRAEFTSGICEFHLGFYDWIREFWWILGGVWGCRLPWGCLNFIRFMIGFGWGLGGAAAAAATAAAAAAAAAAVSE